jgi:hypothetical protein
LWRAAVAAGRRNKDVWSSLGPGLSLALSSDIVGDSHGDFLGDTLGDILGDVLAKYGASLREYYNCICYYCVWYLFYGYGDSLSCATLGEGELYLS